MGPKKNGVRKPAQKSVALTVASPVRAAAWPTHVDLRSQSVMAPAKNLHVPTARPEDPRGLCLSSRLLCHAPFFFCLKRLSRHYLPPVAASGEKDESERNITNCTKRVRRRTQSIRMGTRGHRAWCIWRGQGALSHGRATGCRPPWARHCKSAGRRS